MSEHDQDFIADIEERENAGTPGTLQVLKAALAFQVKDWIGSDRIAAREHVLLQRAMRRWQQTPGIEILGNPDPDERIAIVSFNVRESANVRDDVGRYLHPKFVTALLNDLFGIQSRAGCSCAGPYGHQLLQIDPERSNRYRTWVKKGYGGIKPGWCRIGFHYAMDDAEANYVIDAVAFVAEYGARFVALYRFELASGTWTHAQSRAEYEHLAFATALRADRVEPTARTAEQRALQYRRFLDDAQRLADTLEPDTHHNAATLDGELGELQFFALNERCLTGL
ncbi:MAG TPA: aminotransferase class V-fold PLP-dependent enzyme [Pseudomonadales bacterium]